ncbi:MAG: GNAT family N-acetyltransferase [Mycobacteriales bacterium]
MDGLVVRPDRPDAVDVRALLEAHLAQMRTITPAQDVHALDVPALLEPGVSFFSARVDGTLVGVGALRRLDAASCELKSMHTAAAARGQGVGRSMLDHLLAQARRLGCFEVLLETGSAPQFAAARALYVSAGFASCGPFADYLPSPHSVFFRLIVLP